MYQSNDADMLANFSVDIKAKLSRREESLGEPLGLQQQV